MKEKTLPLLSEEFKDTDFGDVRLTRRLMAMVEEAEANPSGSIPERSGTEASTEAVYRFFSNERVTPESILQPHIENTLKRAASVDDVLAIHDTTEFEFGGEKGRKDLGMLNYEARNGFYGHFSFCISRDGDPLGTVGLYAWSRPEKRKGKRSQYDPDRESLRWFDSCCDAEEKLAGKSSAIHVMDREGDCYELFSQLLEHNMRFTIRLSHNRRAKPGREATDEKLFQALANAPMYFSREVPLSARGKKKRSGKLKKHPQRKARLSQLEVRAQQLEIFQGNGGVAHCPESLNLNFVEVREVNPPDGEEPVVWRLVTTEPIEDEATVEAVVDIYLRRWTIEEFFKTLKTGCGYQKKQLESARTLLIELFIECAVAWRLLKLRWVANHNPDMPASAVLSDTEIAVLRAFAKKKKQKLPASPTARDVLYAVAGMGGHLKNNGPPGWLILRKGFEKLYNLEEGWMLLMEIHPKM